MDECRLVGRCRWPSKQDLMTDDIGIDMDAGVITLVHVLN
jgi:hypothetical protein